MIVVRVVGLFERKLENSEVNYLEPREYIPLYTALSADQMPSFPTSSAG